MTYATISLDISDTTALLTLKRPDKLNSLNAVMHEELAVALQAVAENTRIRALLLTGTGRGFCAGQDLDERSPSRTPPDLGATLDRWYNPLVRGLRALPIPVVAAVNGVAAGAGVGLALACDVVLAAQSASFVMAFSNIGLIPDTGLTWFLPRLIGPARSTALMMNGGKIQAEDAARWGMIWKCVDDENLRSEALNCAQELAQRPTKALGMIKTALNHCWDQNLDQQLDLERTLQRTAGLSSDYEEGVKAFHEKRQPVFAGH